MRSRPAPYLPAGDKVSIVVRRGSGRCFQRSWRQELLVRAYRFQLFHHYIEDALVLADRIVVMRPWPGRILDEIRIDLPRGRDRASASFEVAKRQLFLSLNRSLQPS
ncbi:hypothetical protein QA648_31125 (plasmid) [Rhizobium sp. CB3171]|uniref:hypothetical protein n=1 Tax=Rhizobium sp. CB3171 TaxID=3039157 RepID=UPI0024B12B02|nr:hypothetical protein [Rhizobium sp. CB3171]WFU05180.1 hypothetical protein QA648_31125 [Rhizobium sp. CB3171]